MTRMFEAMIMQWMDTGSNVVNKVYLSCSQFIANGKKNLHDLSFSSSHLLFLLLKIVRTVVHRLLPE